MQGDWKEWSNHVLVELTDLKESQRATHKEVINLRIDMAVLKVKVAGIGTFFGAIGTILTHFVIGMFRP